jgi:glutamate-1-semialdehyde 2,1-aminomutase
MNTLVADYGPPVHNSGTYNANRVCMYAAQAALNELTANDGAAYKHLHSIGNQMITGIRKIFEENKVDGIVQGIGPMFQLYFTKAKAINSYREFDAAVDQATFRRFANKLIENGVYISPIAGEHWFASTAHTDADVAASLKAIEASVRALRL